MADKLLPPDDRRTQDEQDDRLLNLERRLQRADALLPQELKFSLGGPIYVSESSPDSFRYGGTIRTIICRLTVEGSTSTTVTLRSHGTVIATVTIPAGSRFVKRTVDLKTAGDDDALTAAITAVGTGAEGLSMVVRTVAGTQR